MLRLRLCDKVGVSNSFPTGWAVAHELSVVCRMCLILVAWKAHHDYPFIVAANRDEFHARATAVAGAWTDAPQVLAGRDLEAGGTWLGVTDAGRFAAVTNVREALDAL